MSDYLWDKTGEREEEVERLEGLLGNLRYKPRPLELPAEVETSATQTTWPLRTHRFFRPAFVAAVAAALLLALVAVALILLRTDATGGGRQSAQTSHESQPRNPATQVTVPPRQEPLTVAREPEKRDVQDVVKDSTHEQERRKERLLASVPKRQREQTPLVVQASEKRDGRLEQMSAGASLDGVALKMRLLAKEQLVYALRLTSTKLREVRKRTQGADEPARAFDEPNHIK